MKQKERDAKLSSVELAALQAKRAKRKNKRKVFFSTIVILILILI